LNVATRRTRAMDPDELERTLLAATWAKAPLTFPLIGRCWEALRVANDPRVRSLLEDTILLLHAFADFGHEASADRRSVVLMLIDFAEGRR